jgi:hypothetical protein
MVVLVLEEYNEKNECQITEETKEQMDWKYLSDLSLFPFLTMMVTIFIPFPLFWS